MHTADLRKTLLHLRRKLSLAARESATTSLLSWVRVSGRLIEVVMGMKRQTSKTQYITERAREEKAERAAFPPLRQAQVLLVTSYWRS